MPMGGYGDPLGDQARQGCGYALQHQGVHAGLFKGPGVLHEPHSRLERLALHLVAPQLVHGLGRKADVPHDGDARGDDALHRGGHVDASLQLHSLRAALLEEAARVAQRVGGAGLVGHEGHVPHYESARGAPCHGLGVVYHLVHGDG